MAECLITRRGREVSSTSLPEFTYTGNYSFIDDGENIKGLRKKFADITGQIIPGALSAFNNPQTG